MTSRVLDGKFAVGPFESSSGQISRCGLLMMSGVRHGFLEVRSLVMHDEETRAKRAWLFNSLFRTAQETARNLIQREVLYPQRPRLAPCHPRFIRYPDLCDRIGHFIP